MDKYVGKRLDGRYELQELIGVGGMAMVYKAYDTIDDKIVAVKILKDEFLGNDEFIRRFKNESKAIAVLSHPNIVRVFDVSFGDRIQYIVMEYIDGITLKEYIEHQGVIQWKEAVHFTVQILEALQHAHEKGVVHRDIKPQNIILLQDGTIKVTDFGIARLTTNETRTMTDTAIGSVHYIAPEQARGDITDGKADIYSIGVMLYEMLTGKLPFEADSAVSVAIMQLQTEPKPLRDINEEIPAGLEEITLKAMRKEPSQRYETAKDMLEAIDMFCHNPNIHFEYKYYIDESATKPVEALNTVRTAAPEPAYDDNYDYGIEADGENKSKTAVKWATIAISAVVVVAVAVLIIMFSMKSCSANSAKDVDVPQFIGMMYDDIKNNPDYKFDFKIEVKYDATKPLMQVLDQDPKAGSKKVKENAQITLTINSDTSKVSVPTVKGLPQADAENKIKAQNLYAEIKTVYDPEIKKGFVKDCSPQEGTEQQIGTTIILFVSDGPEPETVTIPTSIIGKPYSEVETVLKRLGLEVTSVDQDSSLDKDVVISSEPYAGNVVAKGSLVTVYKSSGKLPVGSEKTFEYSDFPEERADVSLEVRINGTLDEDLSKDSVRLYELEKIEIKGTGNNVPIAIAIDGETYKLIRVDFTKDTPEIIEVKEDNSDKYKLKTFKLPAFGSGDKWEDVEKTLKSDKYGLNPIKHEQADESVPKGYVIKTNPEAETEVNRGTSLDVFVSTGAPKEEIVNVRDVLGLTLDQVQSRYGDKLDIQSNETSENTGGVAEGTVTSATLNGETFAPGADGLDVPVNSALVVYIYRSNASNDPTDPGDEYIVPGVEGSSYYVEPLVGKNADEMIEKYNSYYYVNSSGQKVKAYNIVSSGEGSTIKRAIIKSASGDQDLDPAGPDIIYGTTIELVLG